MNKRAKQSFAVLLAATIVAGGLSAAHPATVAAATDVPGTPYLNGGYNVNQPHVVINQIYGAGAQGDTETKYFSNGFIELYNQSNSPVSLDGWAIYYSGHAGNSQTGALDPWSKLTLTGTIPANGTYLVTGASTGAVAPFYNLTGDRAWPTQFILNKGMKVYLSSDANAPAPGANPFADKPAGYVDLVGTGSNDADATNDGYEGNLDTASKNFPYGKNPTVSPVNPGGISKKIALRRISYQDSDVNVADFEQVTYDTLAQADRDAKQPHNSGIVQPLGIDTQALPNGKVGNAYSVTLDVYGGVSPYVFSGSNLPDGLNVSAGGVISGTPTAAGNANVTLLVTDGQSPPATATKQLTLTVAPADVALAISTTTLPKATIGQAYAGTIGVTGGTAPYSITASDLPAGLTLDAGSGAISGTPAATNKATTTKLNVTVTDAASGTQTATIALTVAPATIPYTNRITMDQIASYSVGEFNADGGIAEIVKYNKDNGKFYLVNGSAEPPTVEIVALDTTKSVLEKEKDIPIQTMAEHDGFVYGDVTSVDINTTTKRISVSVQEEDYSAKGKILVLDYDGNLVREYEAGVQPDMIKSTPDGRYILTADEGEPRQGHEAGAVDPEGSVTIVDTVTGAISHVRFDNESVIADDVHVRGPVANAQGQVVTAGTKADAVRDFEPEYIALSDDHAKAYVTLQENNAIATIDIASKRLDSVKSLGYKDYNDPRNVLDLVKDGAIKLENVPFKGIYMPDGVASFKVGTQTYLITANEGDSTQWPVNDAEVYSRNTLIKLGSIKESLNHDSEVYKFLASNGTTYNNTEVLSDMADPNNVYMFGGRSFSIWNADTMQQVYDSGSDFERITSQVLPQYFNTSHSKLALDDRSAKKGPEPEDVKVGKVGDKTFAFVGLERIGGIMTYDVTNPANVQFANYTNKRDFTASNVLDTFTGPEGIDFIPASDSPTGRPLLLVAYEVGGRVGVMELNVTKVALDTKTLSLKVGNGAGKLTATVTPVGGGANTVTWTSSNTAIATVDANGNVTPRSAGTAVIRALSADGYGDATATVTVTGGSVYVPPASGGNNSGNSGNSGNNDNTTELTAEQIDKALAGVSGASKNLTLSAEAGQTGITLLSESFGKIASSGLNGLTVGAGGGTLTFDGVAIKAIGAVATSGDVSVSVNKTDVSAVAANLPQAAKDKLAQTVGNRPIYDFKVTANGKSVSTFGGGSVEVSVPYTLGAGENPNAIVAYYVTDAGKLELVQNAVYDKATGKLTFSVKHFSTYAVAYNNVAYNDTANNFANDDITFLSARELLVGVGENRFAPEARMTRADFVLLLSRVASADLSGNAAASFSDFSGSAYYAKAVGWASANGIVEGVGAGKFDPSGNVTRAQMVAIIDRYVSYAKAQWPRNVAPTTFSDASSIPAFAASAVSAAQQAGIIAGRANAAGETVFAPQDFATRAETAKIVAILMQELAKQ